MEGFGNIILYEMGNHQETVSVTFKDETFNISLHLKNIFSEGELIKDSVTEKFSATASGGKNYLTQFYNLDAIISVCANFAHTATFRKEKH